MVYIIQDMASEKYLKHDGSTSDEHPFVDVNSQLQAEPFEDFGQVTYAAIFFADHSRSWRIIDTRNNQSFIHDNGSSFKPEPSHEDPEEELPATKKFRWTNRLGCVEALAAECAEGSKFEIALRSIRIRSYCQNVGRMPVMHKNALKRDVLKEVKDIQHMRESAEVGDVVRVPKLTQHPLLSSYKRESLKLVEAVVMNKVLISSAYRYEVKRVEDGGNQKGNGHMIKSIVKRASPPHLTGKYN